MNAPKPRYLRAIAPALDRHAAAWLRRRGVAAFQRRAFHTAIRYWLRAAAAGDAESAFLLGDAYQTGAGVFGNWSQAAGFYRLAAERGHGESQLRLARILISGADTGLPEKWRRV